MKKCFILTMWYVNTVQILFKNSATTSFILTMWYVNNKEDYEAIYSILVLY